MDIVASPSPFLFTDRKTNSQCLALGEIDIFLLMKHASNHNLYLEVMKLTRIFLFWHNPLLTSIDTQTHTHKHTVCLFPVALHSLFTHTSVLFLLLAFPYSHLFYRAWLIFLFSYIIFTFFLICCFCATSFISQSIYVSAYLLRFQYLTIFDGCSLLSLIFAI